MLIVAEHTNCMAKWFDVFLVLSRQHLCELFASTVNYTVLPRRCLVVVAVSLALSIQNSTPVVGLKVELVVDIDLHF